MKLLSFNVKGMGSRVKWKEIRRIISKEEVDIVCVHDTDGGNEWWHMCGVVW